MHTGMFYGMELPCFRCGKPAVGVAPIVTGTKEGFPIQEEDVAVCEECYAVLKEKVRTRSKIDF